MSVYDKAAFFYLSRLTNFFLCLLFFDKRVINYIELYGIIQLSKINIQCRNVRNK